MEKVLEVKVLKKETVGYLYPDFDSLEIIGDTKFRPTSGRSDKWNQYLDSIGRGFNSGFFFDKTCSIHQAGVGSPKGTCWAMMIVPEAFADQAAAMFPLTCTILSDADAKTFYEDKVSVYEGTQKVDLAVLQAIKLKNDLSIALTADEADAVDPAKDQPGVVISKTKTWAALKAFRSVEE